MMIKSFLNYLSQPSTFAVYQLLIICFLGFQVQSLLQVALTNPEGTATILKSIPYNKSNSLIETRNGLY